MEFIDRLFIAFRYIKDRFLESFMVVLGLGLGIGIIAGVTGLIQSYFDETGNEDNPWMTIIRVESKVNSWDWMVPIWKVGEESMPDVQFSIDDILDVRETCPDVAFAWIDLWDNLHPGESWEDFYDEGENYSDAWWENEIYGNGVSLEAIEVNNLRVIEGVSLTEQDIEQENPVLIMGNYLAENLYKEESPIGETIRLNGIDFTILGIFVDENLERRLEKNPDEEVRKWDNPNKVYYPYTLNSYYRETGEMWNLSFKAGEYERLEDAVSQLEHFFSSRYGEDTVSINSQLTWNRQNDSVAVRIFVIIGFIAAAGVVIAAINILNLMMARVLRRNRQIGISIALGADRGQVFSLFLTESGILSILGGICGCGLAFLIKILLTGIFNSGEGGGPSLEITPLTLLVALGITGFLSLIFAVYPAYKASRTIASDVLRSQ